MNQNQRDRIAASAIHKWKCQQAYDAIAGQNVETDEKKRGKQIIDLAIAEAELMAASRALSKNSEN